MSKLLVVTPIHNERSNIVQLCEQMAASTLLPTLWVIVDDGSTDGGAELIDEDALPMPTRVLKRENGGGLVGGSAFTAWQYGIDHALADCDYDMVMKLDADVELEPTYLEEVAKQMKSGSNVGLVGGVLVGLRDREQTVHVPGPVKMYSFAAYEAMTDLPRAVGFDVMDEVCLKSKGFEVVVRRDLHVSLRRAIGASQGRVHGRRRNGKVCRWTGYWWPYFILHAIRYFFRPPYAVGSLAMVYGFLDAGPGPYDSQLRRLHAAEQKRKLRSALRSPRLWVKTTYGIDEQIPVS
ncbi:glycosyltransferase [Gordonia alkanivorans]|uniref:glycosyltransferase n=1 Tax=Gordonia alkanivorans TaxID=84096 RepID=UPI002446EC6C|nr:glycosyltransferase [Gordonia alkanivorans]MDH3012549.1 glycosyltransferase [Gordonia alkanivorans]